MFKSVTLPDGTLIETCVSGAVVGPSQQGGLHYGTTRLWYRLNSGEWLPSVHRNSAGFWQWVALSKTKGDFLLGEEELLL